MPGPLFRSGWGTVVCAGGGPSFDASQANQIDAARIAGLCRVIAVNSSWLVLPDADVLYACDGPWWIDRDPPDGPMMVDKTKKWFKGELWTQDAETAERFDLNHITSTKKTYGIDGVDSISQGGNAGHQAIGLARLFGATRIILTGYDMSASGGRRHHHPDYLKPLRNPTNFKTWIERMGVLAADLERAGVDVINCSGRTALTCFRRASLEAALGA